MKVRLLLISAAFLLMFSTIAIFSQDEEADPLRPGLKSSAIYLGPVAGYNRSMHSVNLASFAEDPLCPFFENGSSNGYHFGLFYEQLLGNVVGSKHSIVARVLYNTFPSSLSKIGDKYPSLVPDGKGGYTTIESSTQHSVEVSYSTISVDLMYKFNVVSGLVLTAGPTFDFPISKKLTQKYEIIEPLNVQFKRVADWQERGYVYQDNDRTIVVYDGDIGKPNKSGQVAQSSSFRFGMKFGVQYEIITGSKIDIIPGLFYNLGLTSATSAETWKVSAIQASVDVRFAL